MIFVDTYVKFFKTFFIYYSYNLLLLLNFLEISLLIVPLAIALQPACVASVLTDSITNAINTYVYKQRSFSNVQKAFGRVWWGRRLEYVKHERAERNRHTPVICNGCCLRNFFDTKSISATLISRECVFNLI